MKEIVKFFWAVVKGFVYGSIAIQIVLGAIYIGCNLTSVPQFQETTGYLEMAQTLRIDEYTAVLYPLLLRFLSGITFIPFQMSLYTLQILVGLFCAYHFAYTWTEKKTTAWLCSLWINTIPFVAQAHVSVLPHSLAFSFLILILLELFKGVKYKEPLTMSDFTIVLCSYTLLVQLGRAYFLPATLLLLWTAFLQLYQKENKLLLFGVTILISLGVFVSNASIYQTTQTPGANGRIQRTIESMLFQRLGMSTMTDRFTIYMPEEIEECFTGEELETFARYPYRLQEEFGPVLETRYGKQYANALYWKMALLGFGNATKDTMLDIAEDTLNYSLPAGMYFTWRNGELKGLTGWNYQQFVEQAPWLSAVYIKISQFFWAIGFAASIVAALILMVYRRNLLTRFWMPVGGYILINALYFAMQGANVYDYKLALFPLALSYAGILCMFLRTNRFMKEL